MSACVPKASGSPTCAPAGSGSEYFPCATRATCAPESECANTGVSSCCLPWCNVALNDCLNLSDTCTPLGTPVYVNGVQYGVCYDGLSC